MSFMSNFTRIAVSRGTTPSAVVREIGLSSSKVTIWKSSLPKEEVLLQLADALNCNVMDFFDDDPDADRCFTLTDGDEIDIITAFRKLDRRGKHEFMSYVYGLDSASL